MVSHQSSVYYLGTETVHHSTINSWMDRVKTALSSGHKEALKLALTFYDGSAKAVVGRRLDVSCFNISCCNEIAPPNYSAQDCD